MLHPRPHLDPRKAQGALGITSEICYLMTVFMEEGPEMIREMLSPATKLLRLLLNASQCCDPDPRKLTGF